MQTQTIVVIVMPYWRFETEKSLPLLAGECSVINRTLPNSMAITRQSAARKSEFALIAGYYMFVVLALIVANRVWLSGVIALARLGVS